MNPCEHCGAKPNRGGKINFHKKGCPQKEVTIPPVSLEEILPTFKDEPVVVKRCSTCVCCVKPWSGMNECHRYPPSGGQWARVGPGDWCKEWEQKGG